MQQGKYKYNWRIFSRAPSPLCRFAAWRFSNIYILTTPTPNAIRKFNFTLLNFTKTNREVAQRRGEWTSKK